MSKPITPVEGEQHELAADNHLHVLALRTRVFSIREDIAERAVDHGFGDEHEVRVEFFEFPLDR